MRQSFVAVALILAASAAAQAGPREDALQVVDASSVAVLSDTSVVVTGLDTISNTRDGKVMPEWAHHVRRRQTLIRVENRAFSPIGRAKLKQGPPRTGPAPAGPTV